MIGYRKLDGSTVLPDGTIVYKDGTRSAPGASPYPPAAEIGGLHPVTLPDPPATPGIFTVEATCTLNGKRLPNPAPGQPFVVYEDGSAEYMPHKGTAAKPPAPPGSFIYPPPYAGLVDVKKTVPCPPAPPPGPGIFTVEATPPATSGYVPTEAEQRRLLEIQLLARDEQYATQKRWTIGLGIVAVVGLVAAGALATRSR